MKCALLLAAALFAVPVAAAAQTPADPPPFKAVKIILVGDSTMAVNSGWGGAFCGKHVMSAVACVNLGRGGRGTKTYRAEGSWTLAQHEMKSGGFAETYVLVQFAHNDAFGRAERLTDLATEFPANLERYVADIRAAGARPVLVTPLTRRQFKDGQLIDDLAPWTAAVRAVAARLNVPLVDLAGRSRAAVAALGPAGAMAWAETAPSPPVLAAARSGATPNVKFYEPAVPGQAPPPPEGPPPPPQGPDAMGRFTPVFDYTHLGETGADASAALVADELAKAVPALRRNLVP